MHWSSKLRAMGACNEAVEWARTQPSYDVAWASCERGDWMLWLAGRRIGSPGSLAHRAVVRAAAQCARLSLAIYERRCPGDDRPRVAICAVQRWARTGSERDRSAAYAAAAASDAAYASNAAAAYAAAAASDAAYAAAAASDAAYASNAAASDAAYAAYAAYAAAAAAAADAADADARARVLKRCAGIVRRYVARPALGKPRKRGAK